jgi:FkbM family methyltransferase
MVIPSSFPVARLVDEGPSEDQSLNYVAFVPSESGLIKMLYRAGFPHVYVSNILPDHEDFHETRQFHRKRTIIVAARAYTKVSLFRPASEAVTINPWLKSAGPSWNRFYRFWRKPWREKVITARHHFKWLWFQLIPSIPLPIRLPYGGWWLAERDLCSELIFAGNYEKAEWHFVEHFLKKGITVVDIGAHHGFYTILAAKKVGPSGCVIAFEPSPRERLKLSSHLKLNRCKNVKVEPFALASQDGEAIFFLVQGSSTRCNSLRRPAISESMEGIMVNTMTLDNYLKKEEIFRVDFVKMDVEGAELDVLKGASELLSRNPRPVIMAEVYDIRTNPWGYPASEIYDSLAAAQYQWFSINSHGRLQPCPRRECYEANLVAVPQERISEIKGLIESERSIVL